MNRARRRTGGHADDRQPGMAHHRDRGETGLAEPGPAGMGNRFELRRRRRLEHQP